MAGSAAAAVGWTELVWPRIAALFEPGPDFEPITGLPGYRRFKSAGPSSTALSNPFVGIEAAGSEEPGALPKPLLPSDPCTALYGPTSPGRVQLAVFTDFNCPYCRTLDRRLFDLVATRSEEVTLKVHQLPLLGESSRWAARGALAARQQNAYTDFHKSLMSAAFVVDPDYLATVADSLNLDGEKLMRDALGPVVTRDLAVTQAVAERLGVFGTPGLLVGRTLVLGSISEATLNALIAKESRETTQPDCSVFK